MEMPISQGVVSYFASFLLY